ncbi:hypothetical protein ERHA54_02600 [Erwinia rhapontici]|nr:hypothetical protein EDF84_10559 [Erwinia rhapontici]BCQ37657.1 hypothetical protein ERHA54_02600 [Erwinia rhapontici]
MTTTTKIMKFRNESKNQDGILCNTLFEWPVNGLPLLVVTTPCRDCRCS